MRTAGQCRACFTSGETVADCPRCEESRRGSAKSKRKKAKKADRGQRKVTQEQRKGDYVTFINSRAWAGIRMKFWAQVEYQCAACGYDKGLHVHHMTYVRFGGKELLTDLVGLCEACHQAVHELHRAKGGSLKKATLTLVKSVRPRQPDVLARETNSALPSS